MPRGDGTGPVGMGPGVWRAVGHGGRSPVYGLGNFGWRTGIGGRGWAGSPWWGGGRGLCRRSWTAGMPAGSAWAQPPEYPVVDRETEISALRMQAKTMEDVLARINERLAELAEQKPD